MWSGIDGGDDVGGGVVAATVGGGTVGDGVIGTAAGVAKVDVVAVCTTGTVSVG